MRVQAPSRQQSGSVPRTCVRNGLGQAEGSARVVPPAAGCVARNVAAASHAAVQALVVVKGAVRQGNQMLLIHEHMAHAEQASLGPP